MKPVFVMGRLTSGPRRFFNRIEVKYFALGLAALTFLGIWAILASAYLPSRYELAPGDVARESIVSPRTVSFENEAATERRRLQAAEEVPRVYSFNPEILPQVVKDVNDYFDSMGSLITQERALAESQTRPFQAVEVQRKLAALPGTPQIPDSQAITIINLSDERRAQVRSVVIDGISRIMQGNVSDSTLQTDRERLTSVLQTAELTGDEVIAAEAVGNAFVKPNNIFDEEKTRQAKERAASDVPPIMVTLVSGQTVVSAGHVVSEDDIAAIDSLGLSGSGRKYGAIMGLGLVALIETLFVSLYIRRFEKKVRPSRSLQFIVASLVLVFTLMARVTIVEPISPLLMPVAALGMLGTFMLGTRLAVIMAIVCGANLAVIAGPDPQFTLVALFGGVCGAFLVTNLSQRRDLVRAGFIAGGVIVTTAIGAGQIAESSFARAMTAALWGSANAVLSIGLTGALLTFYEMLFNLPTPLKLLELADPTRPLLKELMMKAPGTYNHSIIMGNIAETAAEAIGANPLLARAGAYYHDIGKLNRPEYFIENQFHIQNPHDRLTPGLSRLAITAHVKDGEQLAREEGLPPEIVDMIREHHGTTILSYFYHKAKELQEVREGRINEETYRYAGHKPTSREAAIIMLADSVEAAVRSMRNPTLKNIKTIIREIFDQRMRDGQLSECNMTFSDLEKVRQVFEKSLQGFASTRIAYPGGEEKPRGPRPKGFPSRTGTGG
jgi:hypothetical protein